MAPVNQASLASHLNEIKLSFYKAKVDRRNKFLLAINYNIPRGMVKSEIKCYKALHFLFWCLMQDLRLVLPLSYRNGSYSITCNTLLQHKHTGEFRQFRQSFNSQQKDYNVLQQFQPIESRAEMARTLFNLVKNKEQLFATINLPISRDSAWQLVGVLSIVINCQIWVSSQQIQRVGMENKKMRHFVTSTSGKDLVEIK